MGDTRFRTLEEYQSQNTGGKSDPEHQKNSRARSLEGYQSQNTRGIPEPEHQMDTRVRTQERYQSQNNGGIPELEQWRDTRTRTLEGYQNQNTMVYTRAMIQKGYQNHNTGKIPEYQGETRTRILGCVIERYHTYNTGSKIPERTSPLTLNPCHPSRPWHKDNSVKHYFFIFFSYEQ